ncbi:uncharacterized protein LOC117173282 [Belonocnema kinseyi]|uniref:uncharacterized protein LOC117173282 n=1 Tax=Belonocnema kinseyi TaxID=2817044 RepID=UPI00143D5166|nr:uncharacterized protein LOC117173282 [Belonocnema kinseyi]
MAQTEEVNMQEGILLAQYSKPHPFHFKYNLGHLQTTPGKIKSAIVILPFLGCMIISIFTSGLLCWYERLPFFIWALIATLVPTLSFVRFVVFDHERLPRWYRYRLLKTEFFAIAVLLVVYTVPIIVVSMGRTPLFMGVWILCIFGILLCSGYGIYTWIRLERMELKLCGEAYQQYNSLPVHFMY